MSQPVNFLGVLASTAGIFHYLQSTEYDRTSQFTYKYNDPIFNISWPYKEVILSKRDSE